MNVRAALAVVLLAGCAATPTPGPDELADALAAFGDSRPGPLDLSHIACSGIDEEPGEFACRWRQRSGGRWHDRQAFLTLSSAGWQLIDAPAARP